MALDPYLLSSLEPLLQPGGDPLNRLGATPAAPGAAPGAATGPTLSAAGPGAPSGTNFRGSQFLRPGPNLAAARAAAGAAPAAPGVASASGSFLDALTRARSIPGATGAAVRAGAGAAAIAPLAVSGGAAAGAALAGERDPETVSLIASNPLEFIARGLAELYAKNAPEFLGGLPQSTIEAAEQMNVSAFEDSPFAFGARPSATPPSRAPAPAAPAAPATAPAPTSAPQPEPIVAITNPDGSTSYTNVRQDMIDTIERGGTMREITPETSRGTVSTVPGVTPVEKAQALSASLRDREFGTARAIATTPEQLQQVETAEKLFDAQQAVLTARTRVARRAAETNLANLQAITIAGEGAKAAQTKALAELLKGAPAAAKAAAETTAITQRNALVQSLLKSKKIDPANAAVLLGGGTPERPTTAVTPSLIPGQPSEVIQVRGGEARQLPVRQPLAPGQVYTDTNTGLQYKVDKDGKLQPLTTK